MYVLDISRIFKSDLRADKEYYLYEEGATLNIRSASILSVLQRKQHGKSFYRCCRSLLSQSLP